MDTPFTTANRKSPGSSLQETSGVGTMGAGVGETGPGVGETGPGVGEAGPGVGETGPGVGETAPPPKVGVGSRAGAAVGILVQIPQVSGQKVAALDE